MPGLTRSLRRAPSRAFVSALALACGAMAVSAAPAAAQAPAAAKPSYSPDFVKVYQPVAAIANAPTGDYAAAKAQLPAIVAAAQTADDKNAAGNLSVILGTKLNDRALQRQGLELMLASGKLPADKVGQMQFLLGNLAYDAKDYAGARTALEAARAAGYSDESMPGLLAESYFKQNQVGPGLDYLKGVIAQRNAAHTAVPDNWLLRGLQVAYENKMAPQSNEWATMLVSASPTPGNWLAALQVVQAVDPFDKSAQLDLYRLMALTGALKTKADYEGYIEAADPRIMSNEVTKVLEAGVTAGALKPGETDYQEFKRIADQRAPVDRAEAPKLAAEARTSANGTAALNAGDVLYSLGQYDQAEAMYQLAIQKGGVDKDKALTRLGIAQIQGGKAAAAKATFAQVGGARAPLARMWQAYAQSKGG